VAAVSGRRRRAVRPALVAAVDPRARFLTAAGTPAADPVDLQRTI